MNQFDIKELASLVAKVNVIEKFLIAMCPEAESMALAKTFDEVQKKIDEHYKVEEKSKLIIPGV